MKMPEFPLAMPRLSYLGNIHHVTSICPRRQISISQKAPRRSQLGENHDDIGPDGSVPGLHDLVRRPSVTSKCPPPDAEIRDKQILSHTSYQGSSLRTLRHQRSSRGTYRRKFFALCRYMSSSTSHESTNMGRIWTPLNASMNYKYGLLIPRPKFGFFLRSFYRIHISLGMHSLELPRSLQVLSRSRQDKTLTPLQPSFVETFASAPSIHQNEVHFRCHHCPRCRCPGR